jgi:hypothetical protein
MAEAKWRSSHFAFSPQTALQRNITVALPGRASLAPLIERRRIRASIAGEGTNLDIP